MRILITAGLLALSATPALSFERMMRSDCRAAIEQLSDLMSDSTEKTEEMVNATRITPQGWCETLGGAQGVKDAEFETFEWRAEGISRWIRDGIPPLALEVKATGLDPDVMQNSAATDRPLVDVTITLRQRPDAGQLIVERAVMDNNSGDVLFVSGVFERIFLSSLSMTQMSVGAATFKAGLMTLTLGGDHENPFGFKASFDIQGAEQTQRDVAFQGLSNLPDGLISDQSRAELVAFAGDLPKPVGTLEVSVTSERGLGLMQVGASMAMSGLTMPSRESGYDHFEVLFDGLTIDANWTPIAQTAD